MKTKRLDPSELYYYKINRRSVLFQRFDDPVVDIGVIVDSDEKDFIIISVIGGHEKLLTPLEDYVFYSLEVDGGSIDDNSGE